MDRNPVGLSQPGQHGQQFEIAVGNMDEHGAARGQPGLIDLHGHYRVSYAGVAKDDTVAMPKIFLANGVTATFPAGEVEPYKMH